MKRNQRKSHKARTHQTVTPEIKLKAGNKTILISTTDQKLSAHAGQANLKKFGSFLAGVLPHRPSSPNALPALDIALGFISGILSGADKLARIAHLRTDPLGAGD